MLKKTPDDELAPPEARGGVHTPAKHDSAPLHVTGRAVYADDAREARDQLHAYLGLANAAHGVIKDMDLSDVLASPGVLGVLTAADIDHNDISPTGRNDEPVLAEGEVLFHGQPVFCVVAETREEARRAAQHARLDIVPRHAVIDAADATEMVCEPLALQRGDAPAALETAPRRVTGEMRIGGQDHFYLEGHIASAVPGEDGEMTVTSSTQHPSEVQHMVAHVLGVPSAKVTVVVRRMGGGFGGKETQSNQFAALAALCARRFERPVRIRPDRDDDMIATGKRHDFLARYDVGFDDEGRILALDATYRARCGFSSDLSGPVTDRTLFHAENAYFLPDVRLVSEPMKTNTVSNTAYRGFGGPQGVVGAERAIEEVAYALGLDTLEVRRRNFYGPRREGDDERNVTPYHQEVEDNILDRIVDELEASADYQARRAEVLAFNERSPVIRRGIALTPVKFGISFTATWYNQAGALIHIYRDGSVHLNHGGTEMGQGLHTKVAQVVASEFGIDLDQVHVTATRTDKVPNTSATAASSGSDLNGMAAQDACRQIKERLVAFVHERLHGSDPRFDANHVTFERDGRAERVPFAEFVDAAYMARVQLSAAGFYKTPLIHWDRSTGRGRPFYYYAYGAACSEVSVDTLTGEYHIDRVDILHDVGKSLNPALDIGQIEGGFVQGMGWLTSEELVWDADGRLKTHAPATYKIPIVSDRPPIFNVALAERSENKERTIRRSKAVGEPPFMLAVSVFEALGHAVASLADYREAPRLNAPATPEEVFWGCERMRELAMKTDA